MRELSELPTRICLNRATRRWYDREFSNLIAIERGSKIAYPNVSMDVCLNEGGNIAAGSDGVHVYLDNDKRRLANPYQVYMLLPPSVSCRFQGHKGIVRDHSSTFNYCNQSPDHRHHYVERAWYNKTPEFLTFEEFWDIVWNARAT